MRVPGNWKECLSFLILFLVAGLASAPGQTGSPPAKNVRSSVSVGASTGVRDKDSADY